MGCPRDEPGTNAGQRIERDPPRSIHHRIRKPPIQSAIACEGELASCFAGRTLKHYTTDGFGIGRVLRAIKHHFCDRLLSGERLKPRFVGNGQS
jgi:hypothetical protein